MDSRNKTRHKLQSRTILSCVGELGNTRASIALDVSDDINYVEFEYSANFSQEMSIELSFEQLLSSNFVTGEFRYQTTSEVTYATKLIDTNYFKFVISTEKSFDAYSQEWEVFAYYSYVSDNFGARSELTGDSRATGHGVDIELQASFQFLHFLVSLNWFAKFEAFEGNTRVQLGVKYGLSLYLKL